MTEEYLVCENCGHKTKYSNLCWNCANPDLDVPKYPKIKRYDSDECEGLLDGEIIIQDKDDGSNIGFRVKNGKLIFRAREWVSEDRPELASSKPFKQAKEFLELRIDKLAEGFIYYGELIGKINPHRIVYDVDIDIIVFDIFDPDFKRFLDPDECEVMASLSNLKYTHCFETGIEIDEAIKDIEKRGMEGIVIKNYERQMFGKLVVQKFKEKVSAKFVNKGDGIERVFVEETVTFPRIEKLMFKAHEEGTAWDNRMKRAVLIRIYEDIIREELVDFVLKKGGKLRTFNFKLMKQHMVDKSVVLVDEVLAARRLNA